MGFWQVGGAIILFGWIPLAILACASEKYASDNAKELKREKARHEYKDTFIKRIGDENDELRRKLTNTEFGNVAFFALQLKSLEVRTVVANRIAEAVKENDTEQLGKIYHRVVQIIEEERRSA